MRTMDGLNLPTHFQELLGPLFVESGDPGSADWLLGEFVIRVLWVPGRFLPTAKLHSDPQDTTPKVGDKLWIAACTFPHESVLTGEKSVGIQGATPEAALVALDTLMCGKLVSLLRSYSSARSNIQTWAENEGRSAPTEAELRFPFVPPGCAS